MFFDEVGWIECDVDGIWMKDGECFLVCWIVWMFVFDDCVVFVNVI